MKDSKPKTNTLHVKDGFYPLAPATVIICYLVSKETWVLLFSKEHSRRKVSEKYLYLCMEYVLYICVICFIYVDSESAVQWNELDEDTGQLSIKSVSHSHITIDRK